MHDVSRQRRLKTARDDGGGLGVAQAQGIGGVKAVAISVFIFSVFTAACGLATDVYTFGVLRFIAGIGLGGVVPAVTATVSTFAPRRVRSFVITGVFACYSVGGVVAALLGRQLMESMGWQIVFYCAGLPVLLIPLILKFLPGAPSVLQQRGDQAAMRALAQRIDPSLKVDNDTELYTPVPQKQAKVPITRLFQEGRGFSTVMLWVTFFSGLFMLYALNAWLTKLMAMAGYGLQSALMFDPARRCGIVYAINGTGADPEASPGRHSSYPPWEERLQALLWAVARG